MDTIHIEAAADELFDMRRTQRVEPDLVDRLRPATLDEGYAIQERLVGKLLPAGERLIGFKAACTSQIAQQALRVKAPLFGRLLSHTSYPTGAVLDADRFVHRVVESEFAFRIGDTVTPVAGGHTIASIAHYVEAVLPAIEIVDYRFAEWTVGAAQVAADNAIHGAWISGEPRTLASYLDLDRARVVARRNGEVVSTGSGQAVLGHPLAVLAWLADALPVVGLRLCADDLVTTGVTTDVFEADRGDVIDAEFEGVGSVGVAFA